MTARPKHHPTTTRFKILLIVLFIFSSGIGLYLNRSYAHIYQTIDQANLWYPSFDQPQNIPSPHTGKALRYVALGDSLTAGVGLATTTETYIYQFANQIAQNEQPVTLLNLGTPGARSVNVLASQIERAISFQPDSITILIGNNDVHGNTPTQKSADILRQIITQLQTQTSAEIYLLTLPHLGGPSLFYPPYQSYFSWRVDRLNQQLTLVCNPPRCTVVDITTPTKQALTTQTAVYSADHFHPNKVIHQEWANLLYAATHR